MNFVDTHCHIHSLDYPLDSKDVLKDAINSQVTKLICIGVDLGDSELAIDFTNKNPNVWASIGIHPHESKHYRDNHEALNKFKALAVKPRVVAVGECGLDYYYDHSDKADQRLVLEYQLNIATEHKLPVIFHVREAFDDFWQIFDNFKNLQGVIHSYTADAKTLNHALERGLYIGVNGIATFTKNNDQLEVFRQIPLNSLVLETDAPYLTPVPFRGTICQPKHVKTTAEFLARLRGNTLEDVAQSTYDNAVKLFKLKDTDAR